MDFQLTEDQKLLQRTVEQFTKQDSTLERMRGLREDPVGWDQAMWRRMGELGWLSIPFPESIGGFGGSFVEASLVLERLAGTLVPEPYVPSVVLGGLALRQAGNEEQQRRFLTPMIEGKTSLALAYLEPNGRYGLDSQTTRADRTANGFRLSGKKVWVLNGHAADHLIVSATVDGCTGLFVLDRSMNGVVTDPAKMVDGRRAAVIRFDNVEVDESRLLGAPEAGSSVMSRVLDYGVAAAVAEGTGIVQTVLQMTVEYLKERKQFGVPIGSFQALQHRAVDMFVEVELCKSMMCLAAVRADDPADGVRARDLSAAKVQLAWGGEFVVRQSIQLFGGVGITDEYDVGLFFKRMIALNALFGDEEEHVSRFAQSPEFASFLDA